MSNSVQPHRWQPTRLPHPWDSPGKNTGVGCHFLLQCMKVKGESEVVQSCKTVRDPMNAAYQAPQSMGFSRQEYWSAVPLPSYRILSDYSPICLLRTLNFCFHCDVSYILSLLIFFQSLLTHLDLLFHNHFSFFLFYFLTLTLTLNHPCYHEATFPPKTPCHIPAQWELVIF